MQATVTTGLADLTECLVCENPIRTMAFRFTGVCCGNCQKELAARASREMLANDPIALTGDETVVLP